MRVARKSADNEEVTILLLPGMDGTGTLFDSFVRLLPDGLDIRIVRYPESHHLTYEQLADRVISIVPWATPYLIVAESYSGPVAGLVAARRIGDLRAVVFVASFVAHPLGRPGRWLAKVVPAALFRFRIPDWILRWLLLDSAASAELIFEVQRAIASVRPEVLKRRLRDALNADYVALLKTCPTRIICLFPGSDRLLGIRGLRGFVGARPEIEKVDGPHFLLQCAPQRCLAALVARGLFIEEATASKAPQT